MQGQNVKKITGHLHFEGSIPPLILARMAAQNDLPDHSSVFQAYRPQRFRSFSDFSKLIILTARTLRTEGDFFIACQLLGRRLHQEGVLYAEVIWVPQLYLGHRLGLNGILRTLNKARDQILQTLGVEIRWIVDLVRGYPGQGGGVLDWLTSFDPKPQNIVAVGLGGNELHPLSDMLDLLLEARNLGLGLYPHAGEQCGPESICEVIDQLAPTRIAHGIRASESQETLALIKACGIHLDICPISNLALGVYRSMDALPIRTLIDAGCTFSINTDDPAFFGTDLVSELAACMKIHALDEAFIQNMYHQALEATFLDPADKARLRDLMT